MPVQLIRKVRDKQPTGPLRVNCNHPAAVGLGVAVVGGVYKNLANNAPLIRVGFPESSVIDGGKAFGPFPTTSDYLTTTCSPSSSVKTAIVFSVRSGTTGQWQDILKQGTLYRNRFNLNYGIPELFVCGGFRWAISNPGGIDATKTQTWSFSAMDWSTGDGLCAFLDGRDISTYVSYVGAYSSGVSEPFITIGTDSTDPHQSQYEKISCLLYWPSQSISRESARALSINPWQIFEPETIPLFYSTVTAQYARPTSDVSTGTWTASSGNDLFAMLDETSASDADYIVTTGASTCEVALSSLNDPAVSTGHVVRYRISSTTGGITVRLRQGTTTIASWTHNPAPTSLTTYSQTLSAGEADSITNYGALKLQFEAI